MFRFNHRSMIVISGLLWLGTGIFLITFGSSLIIKTCDQLRYAPLIKFSFAKYLSKVMREPHNIAVAILSFSLFLGYVKGKYILSKTVARQIKRITLLPNPASLKSLYSKGYYLLIASMIGAGMGLRLLPFESDIRGCIDVAVGMGLTSGAIQYFRTAWSSFQRS
jgi:hypothetical protein